MLKGTYKRTTEHRARMSVANKIAMNRPEVKAKLRTANLGRKHSIETCRKISKASKNRSPEHQAKITAANKGKKRSPEACKKMSKSHKGKKLSAEHRTRIIESHRTLEYRRKISESQKGEKNHFWKGGISFEPYSPKFNKELKSFIRKRDNHICQLCKKTEKDNNKKLTIHHIDYNKKNSKSKNLITLCSSCNSEVNSNRKVYERIFKNLIRKIYKRRKAS